MKKKERISKSEILAMMAENLSLINESYKPFFNDEGMIAHSAQVIIKSTLKGKPAMSDGSFVGVNFPSPEMLEQLPEWRAEQWHKTYKSFDVLLERVEEPFQKIKPLLFDDYNTIIFNNGATIQRSYYDLFWVKHRADGLTFEQSAGKREVPIIVKAANEIVGIIQPVFWETQEKDFRSCLLEFIKGLGH